MISHTIKVDLGTDDILRVPHTIRSGPQSKPLPKLPSAVIHALRRTADVANAAFLHEVFNHCSPDKVYRTLGVTKGYNQIRLEGTHCDTCAQAKARSIGLSHKHHSHPKDPPAEVALCQTAWPAVSPAL